MILRQAKRFEKTYKKLKANQRQAVDTAIHAIIADPYIGEAKKGNLAYLRVYKFSMVGQQALLGYHFEENELIIVLIAVGPHENFYRDLKH